jgi:hypothetical protein
MFADRIEEKRRMLHDVRAGAELPVLPSVEVDESVVVPQVSQYTKTPVSNVVPAPRDAWWSRTMVAAIAAAAVLAIVAGIAIPKMLGDDPRPAATPDPAPVTAVATAVPEPAPAPAPIADPGPPPAPTEVVIRIESRPAGAKVYLDGEEKGRAPVDLRMPVRDAPAALQLKSRGYSTLSQELRLDRDQTLLLTLSKRKRGKDEPPSDKDKGKGFHRFN